MLSRTILKITGLDKPLANLDKPIVGLSDDEVKKFKRDLTKLRVLHITADLIVGGVIGAILAFVLI